MRTDQQLPITVLVAVKNEEANLPKCLASLSRAERIILLDSQSQDATNEIATSLGAEIVQFHYSGGYPKKRQWGLNELDISTEWVLLLDADEVVPQVLWDEIGRAISEPGGPEAFLITKAFHFLGRRFRFGGFSHSAVLLFRKGRAEFEELESSIATTHDMEVHERVIVDGTVGVISTPLIHQDFKGLTAYIDRHNQYSSWEAGVRARGFRARRYGKKTITPRLFGNTQERRRFLKMIAVRMPFEPTFWFLYHYVFRLGFLEGRRGLIAAQIRASYISQARAKLFELEYVRNSKTE